MFLHSGECFSPQIANAVMSIPVIWSDTPSRFPSLLLFLFFFHSTPLEVREMVGFFEEWFLVHRECLSMVMFLFPLQGKWAYGNRELTVQELSKLPLLALTTCE